jgi:aminoglycoside 6'-N-acetyltransferase I
MINKEDNNEISEYHRMRHILWPRHEEDELYREMLKILDGKTFYKNELSWTTFVAVRDNGELGGFIEITLYPELDFTNSNPVGFIEGWYVDEDLWRTGVGRGLVNAAVGWVKSQGCTEIASDIEKDNLISQTAHKRLGFIEAKTDDECIFYKTSVI